jgi:intergrase/recombinase
MSNTALKVFKENNCKNIFDILSLISSKKLTERRVSTAYRVFLNFLEDKEILEDDILIKLRKKIKLNITTNFDTYVPSSSEIKDN